jgi:hypothetical protein
VERVTAAVRTGKGGPEALLEFRCLEAFWTRFGVDEDRLRTWPRQRIQEYLRIMQVENALKAEPHSAGGQGGGMSQADATEAAYRAMKAAKGAPG